MTLRTTPLLCNCLRDWWQRLLKVAYTGEKSTQNTFTICTYRVYKVGKFHVSDLQLVRSSMTWKLGV